ncbi:uncharacterized protein Z520_06465 [Fonsecaea multimorphosa CBS 102226]|uniref:Bacteriocin-protection protein, YdeI/OmpD-associated family n=1 Tax=Fonsecaea multimorphosa CBS 102226 TaxID=1442371 RepID=A0A0D2JW23_9EURO|nr:uncharacterized protein Z520_06465 [Fonsecaea multimorphosa CBS 102226]KIX97687.1 hypothetical protein Z520_06465 [Fonsecaea multimorphosa CBS 102226]OAL24005.1 hypothetical protein AYO22_06029 [Fonsecaea multimorphosa]
MSSKPLPTDLPIYTFPSAQDFEAFLDREHRTAPGCYVKLAKKAAGVPSISSAEAVEVALCFGWIDGRANRFDENWWLVRYTPRRSKSIWSRKNVNAVARLVHEDKMRPAGIAAVDAAKADGRWARAYDGPATIALSDDLAAALAAVPVASSFFEGLSKSERYAVLWRVQTASPSNRVKRIEAIVQMLASGNVPGRTAKPQTQPKNKQSVKKTVKKKSTARQKVAMEDLPIAQSLPTTKPRQPRRSGLRPRS